MGRYKKSLNKVLFVNPPGSVSVYYKSRISAAVPQVPAQAIGQLAACLLEEDFEVRVLDLLIEKDPSKILKETLLEYQPECVATTFTTPLYNEGKEIIAMAKGLLPDVFTVAGGVHCTTMPEDTLQDLALDAVCIEEGEITLPELLRAEDMSTVQGICYMDNGEPVCTEPRPKIKDLDTLPFPAWRLYDIPRYHTSRITARRNPVGGIITGRGCVYPCTFCNKSVFGGRFYGKSVDRVIDEFKYLLECGFREIHILDDLFVIDMKRAKEICRRILAEELDFTWNIFSGIRVDCVDKEFLELAKAAGCYTVSYGVESGNTELLKSLGKNFSIETIREAFALTDDAGLESVCFFMFGALGETEDTMRQTTDFAISLDPTYAKVTNLLPFPSTPLFKQLDDEGRILTKDWSKYNFHCTEDVWEHPTLTWEQLRGHYNRFYRKFYLRPEYIVKRVKRGWRSGDFLYDGIYAMRNFSPWS